MRTARLTIAARRTVLLVFSAVVVSTAAIAEPAASQQRGLRGHVIIEGVTLAGTQYGTPSGLPTEEVTDPLTIPVRAGDIFKYSTVTCASPFPPWNNVGLHFTPDYPGISDPHSVRHEFSGTVRRVTPSNHGRIEGTITTYLCVSGQRADQVVTSFAATFRPTSETSVPLASSPVPTKGGLAFSGRFRVISGTGLFADLTGQGSIQGQFTRLGTRPGSPAELNPPGYSEVPFQQEGRFRDPTAPNL